MKIDSQFQFPDKEITSAKWSHYFHLLLMIVAVTVISVVALFYSLGYQYNWKTGSIQQTGLIGLNSKVNNFQADVEINGNLETTELPYRSGPLFPGIYTVIIKKPGFQTWNRTLTVEANRVENFRSVVLIKEVPVELPVGRDEQQVLQDQSLDIRDISIRQNELWIDGKFITRSSGDIIAASWYTDRDHVVYQTGKTLWLAEIDGLHTQKLIESELEEPLVYRFLKGGQVLVYQNSLGIKAVQLY